MRSDELVSIRTQDHDMRISRTQVCEIFAYLGFISKFHELSIADTAIDLMNRSELHSIRHFGMEGVSPCLAGIRPERAEGHETRGMLKSHKKTKSS